MSWYDGQCIISIEELMNRFPHMISEDLRYNDEDEIAIVNNFISGDPLLKLSDPKVKELEPVIFYHVFTENPIEVSSFVRSFMENLDENNPYSIRLFRKYGSGNRRFFEYWNGHICSSLIWSQDKLKKMLPPEYKNKDVFILPLKIYKDICLVCGKRTIAARGEWDICSECGWEDEPNFDGDENEISGGPNGHYSISSYREEYLKKKAENPLYRWNSER